MNTNLENSAVGAIAPLILLGPVFGAIGIFSLGVSSKAGQLGLIGVILSSVLMVIGVGMMMWLDNGNGWEVMSIGMLLQPFGWLLFGIANYREQVLPRGNILPLIMGVITALSLIGAFGLWGTGEDVGATSFAVWMITMGVGWVLLGVALQMGESQTAVPPQMT